jgi:predicted acylesterase/phospholipase RssA
MRLSARFQIMRPLDEMEMALVRAAQEKPTLVTAQEEGTLRAALSLARIYKLGPKGREIRVGAFLTPFREEISQRLSPMLLGKKPPTRDQLAPLAIQIRPLLVKTRDALAHRLKDRMPAELIDREIRHKSLVVVSGGGGGTAYVYLGTMALLEEFGLRPALMSGTSMGAILSMFRSRMAHFDYSELINIVRSLTWRKLFRAVSTQNRYGIPAALRLFLRAGLGRYFNVASESHGSGIQLRELPIPTIVTVSGVRRGMLPRPLEYYERLLQKRSRRLFDPSGLARRVQTAALALTEFFLRPEIMTRITLGTDPDTAQFDALDAAGFSSALPGFIHYDVLREDHRMQDLLDGLFDSKGLFRLVDGGLTDNLPAKAAWKAVQRGTIGTRNVFILGLNAFSPKLSTPLWLPLERLAMLTVKPNLPYTHLHQPFRRTLSPLELVPSVEQAALAAELGRKELAPQMPFIARMMAPLPPI